MASSSGKTILDFFKQPAAKRFKRVSSPPSFPSSTVIVANSFSSIALSSPTDGDANQNDVMLPTTTTLNPEQKSRIEFNKSLAKAKRNLKHCAKKVSNSAVKGEGAQYVNLKELLVEESWLQALLREFEKSYVGRRRDWEF